MPHGDGRGEGDGWMKEKGKRCVGRGLFPLIEDPSQEGREGWGGKRLCAETRRSGRQRDREMQAARDGETEILGRRRQQAIGRPSDTGRVKKFRL